MTEIVVAEPFDSEKLPVTLVSEVQRFFRVANQIEIDEPRVAYLCRFYAFEVAHNFDRASSGQGVRQFKTSLLQRLGQDDEVTLRKRRGKSDLHELRRVYWQYKDYIIKHGGEYTLETRPLLRRTLHDLNSMSLTLDQGGVHHSIMQLPENLRLKDEEADAEDAVGHEHWRLLPFYQFKVMLSPLGDDDEGVLDYPAIP
ncbi:putative callose synthase 8 [Sesamum angolense]|uniref:Callose synthase 8 n=1 Tax=Sesamum angolense TaxID=2727404 RepID=A0AAE1VXK8_9LAMI|nr:putative callose synthase 8 [Sesamum angolense]